MTELTRSAIMSPELEELLISKGELRKLTGLDSFRYHLTIYQVLIMILLETSTRERNGELNASIQAFGDREISAILEKCLHLSLLVINILGIRQYFQNNKSPLTNLLIDVKNHNKVVYQIHILDQLQSVGNTVAVEARESVLKALAVIRENLTKALKTERILRENPGFKPESFSIDLSSIRSLQMEEKSSEYGQLFNEALQIGISIQEEVQSGLFRENP